MWLLLLSFVCFIICALIFSFYLFEGDKSGKAGYVFMTASALFLLMSIFLLGAYKYQGYVLGRMNFKYSETPDSIENLVPYSADYGLYKIIRKNDYCTLGYSGGRLYYAFMVKNDTEELTLKKIRSCKTYVHEVDGNYRLEKYTGEKEFWGMKEINVIYRLYVPEGSILGGVNY